MRRIPLNTFAALHAKNTPVFISILDNDSDTTNRLSHLHPLYLKYYLSQAHILYLAQVRGFASLSTVCNIEAKHVKSKR